VDFSRKHTANVHEALNEIRRAIEIAEGKGRFTVFAVVDALTRIAGKLVNAGVRIQVDQKAAGLLALAV
jgi:hypothetical protein